MKAKLIINGKELEVEISQNELNKLTKTKITTGYEKDASYYYSDGFRVVHDFYKSNTNKDELLYKIGNYYSNMKFAEDNFRADALKHNLRRFSAEHRDNKIDWSNFNSPKYCIYFDNRDNEIDIDSSYTCKYFDIVYFDTLEHCKEAVNKFHNELIWYFTKYKDTL